MNNSNEDETVNEIFKRYKQKMGCLRFPINEYVLVDIIEELKGIKIELKEVEEKAFVGLNEGLLMPKKGGFLLKYSTSPFRGEERIISPTIRRRFTICHELAHILFYNCKEIVPKLHRQPEEHICDNIARRLLLPEELLIPKFEEYEYNGDLIPLLRKIADEAKVSLYPLVKRVIEDLSLLEKTIITFWYVKESLEFLPQEGTKKVILERMDSKISQDLKNIITPYWRRKIRQKVWNDVIERTMDGAKKLPVFLYPMYVKSKKRTKERLKLISFSVECDFYSRQLSLLSSSSIPKFISVEKVERVETWP